MYVIPELRAVFLAQPATGSVALGHALQTQLGAACIGGHHATFVELEAHDRLKLRDYGVDSTWTVFTVCRRPVDWFRSMFTKAATGGHLEPPLTLDWVKRMEENRQWFRATTGVICPDHVIESNEIVLYRADPLNYTYAVQSVLLKAAARAANLAPRSDRQSLGRMQSIANSLNIEPRNVTADNIPRWLTKSLEECRRIVPPDVARYLQWTYRLPEETLAQ